MKHSDNISTRALSRFSTLEQSFREVHGNKYDYADFIYHKSRDKSNITCKTHGDFKQCANDHLNGYGCPHCRRIAVETAARKLLPTFIAEATIIHGDKYSYQNVVYINTNTPITIGRTIHGDFQQRPSVHLTVGRL